MCLPSAPKRNVLVDLAELRQHNSRDDAWIAIGDKVYDVTEFIGRHPGGEKVLANLAGADGTDSFRAFHGPRGKASKLLGHAVPCVGRFEAPEPDALVKDFREMVQRYESLNATDYGHYAHLAARLAALLGAALYCVLACEPAWVHMLGAVFLGFFWQQSLFIGHDAGHNAVTHNSLYDRLIGLVVGNTFNGVGIAWWKATHNVHHMAVNSIECDPDIQHIPLFAISDKYFAGVTSLYHNRILKFDGLARLLVSYQHYTFYLIMAVARVNLNIQSLILLATQKNVRWRWAELATMALYFAWVAALHSALPTGAQRAVFFFLSHAVAGMIHVQICISHFSRPTFDGTPKGDWVRMQLDGTMDVGCPAWLDWFHGGLQFQVIHHLWPRVPRHKLRTLVPEVEAMCKKHGVDYHSPGFWAANCEVIKTLKTAAKQARVSPLLKEALTPIG